MPPMPAAAHLVPVALVLAVMTPHPSDSVSMAYDVYPIPTVNPSEVSSNGSSAPSVVMVLSYEHDTNHGSQAEQPEFGSIGTAGFSSMNKQALLNEGADAHEGFPCFLHAFSSEPVGSTPLSLAIKPAALEEVIDDHA